MKKLFALASMMIVVSVSAQQQKKERVEGRGVEYQQKSKEVKQVDYAYQAKQFEKYDLSASQKRKIESAYQQHQEDLKKAKQKGIKDYSSYESSFDKKVEKILSKKQFEQYKKDKKGQVAYYQVQQVKKHK